MRTNSSYFKLGLFVMIGLAMLVAGVIVLGAGAMFKKTIAIETVTTESVDGLEVGAHVKFRGVPIGTVSGIEPAIWRHPEGTLEEHLRLGNQIVLELAINPSAFPTADPREIRSILGKSAEAGLRARVTSSGLTGPCYVELVFVDPKDYPAMQLSWKPDLPYVPSAPNAMSQVVAALESIATGLKRADVEKVVRHVDELLVDGRKAVNDLQIGELRTKVGAVVDSLSTTTGDADRAMVELRRAMRELNGLLSTQRQDIESVIVNLRRVMENAATLTGDLKENPSRAIFGKPPPHRQPGE